MRSRDLRCPAGCTGGRFEALNAPLYVDSRARHLEHDDSLATFVCAECQAVAVDLAAARDAMRRDTEVQPQVLVCPQCGTQMLPPLDDELAPYVECPMCETRFAVEEGMPHLHGTPFDPDADE
jgi:DNA-directed RNA polymerase subunit RPC12/RpoP